MERWEKGIFVSAMVFLFAVLSFTVAFGQSIKIGVIGPMKFVQGIGHWNGATMAAEEINAKGGVQVGNKKMKIELIQSDSNEFLNVTDATNTWRVTRRMSAITGRSFRTKPAQPARARHSAATPAPDFVTLQDRSA